MLFDQGAINALDPLRTSFPVRFCDLASFPVSVRPLSVTILSSEHAPLSANRKYDINCMTVGSRPPAKLSWYMDGRKLTNHTEKVMILQLIERYMRWNCHREKALAKKKSSQWGETIIAYCYIFCFTLLQVKCSLNTRNAFATNPSVLF